MIIYEITATVEPHLVGHYEKYMRDTHIPDLLATGYFAAAFLTRADEGRYRVQYHAHDRAALDDYLKTEADRLRADFMSHFPEGVTVTRENWEVLRSW